MSYKVELSKVVVYKKWTGSNAEPGIGKAICFERLLVDVMI